MTLIERIEAASGADRELDAEIALASGGINRIGYDILWPSGFRLPCPHYTASIDAALTLVPEYAKFGSLVAAKRVVPHGETTPGFVCVLCGEFGRVEAFGTAMSTALCAAALRARETQQ